MLFCDSFGVCFAWLRKLCRALLPHKHRVKTDRHDIFCSCPTIVCLSCVFFYACLSLWCSMEGFPLHPYVSYFCRSCVLFLNDRLPSTWSIALNYVSSSSALLPIYFCLSVSFHCHLAGRCCIVQGGHRQPVLSETVMRWCDVATASALFFLPLLCPCQLSL